MSPGIGYYIIGFRHKGYNYYWNEDINAFYNPVTKIVTKKLLYPCGNLQWASEFKVTKADKEVSKMIDLKNVQPEDAIFNTLADMRKDIKQLLMEIPDSPAKEDRVSAVYYNNMAIFKVMEVLDKYTLEVI